MKPTALTPAFWVCAQIDEADVALAAARGFHAIIANRPDGEARGQPSAASIGAAAAAHGMGFAHVPVVAGRIADSDVAAMADALARLDGPVLAYCASGKRSAALWSRARGTEAGPDAAVKAA